MKLLSMEGTIKVQKGEHKVSKVVEGFVNLPSLEVKEFFEGIGLTVPKKLRMNVLQNVLKEPIEKTLAERSHLADELGYRLTWVEFFTEYQLENLLRFYDSVSLNKRYLSELWLNLLSYMVFKKVSDKSIAQLIEKSQKFNTLPKDILTYNLDLKGVFFDEKDHIDGVTANQFRTVLYKSSTVNEIREIGQKYDVHVPKRLRKEQLADIVVDVLKERNEYTPEVELKVRSMSIVLLQRFAKDNDIKASIELKKEEVIEFVLANASQTKEKYFLPSDQSVYEQELRTNISVEPVVKKEPVVVEEKPVLKKQEKPVVEEKVIVKTTTKHSPQYEEVVKELALLRAELLDHLAKCNCSKKHK